MKLTNIARSSLQFIKLKSMILSFWPFEDGNVARKKLMW